MDGKVKHVTLRCPRFILNEEELNYRYLPGRCEKAPGPYSGPSKCAKSSRGPVKVTRGHIPEGKSKRRGGGGGEAEEIRGMQQIRSFGITSGESEGNSAHRKSNV